MREKPQFFNPIFRKISGAAGAALAMAIAIALTVGLTQSAQAQTFNVIYNFAGGQDGSQPVAGLTTDEAGNLYGTTTQGGKNFGGVVFKLVKNRSGWTFNPLYSFGSGNDDGSTPTARVVFGPDGALYGTTSRGGAGCDLGACGTVFKVVPAPTACKTALCSWTETVLYRFTGGRDGAYPGNGDLIFDQASNLYGTTTVGGLGFSCEFGSGTVFELTPSRGSWMESLLYSFNGTGDGAEPDAGVILNLSGNLYGTTPLGGSSGSGTVFQLLRSGSGWTESTLYDFANGNDGVTPSAGLIFDQSGNLYGATTTGGAGGGGTVFELSPLGGNWIFALLYSLQGQGYDPPPGPPASLVMDKAGNLYGTTLNDGEYQNGSVFKLTPTGGGWSYTNLHDFTGGGDGANPGGGVTLDANGNVYGTAYKGGSGCVPVGCGVAWEITP